MIWIVMLIVALWPLPQAPAQPPPTSIRFHHLHYRVVDPLTAMRKVTGVANAQPTILQGLGVGVRVEVNAQGNPEYVLFDRRDDAAPPPAVGIPAMYSKIATWLSSRGLAVTGDAAQRVSELSARLPGEWLDHIAFSTPNLPDVVARLDRSGARAVRRSDDSILFEVDAPGTRVEIVRDPDAPDRFWCPMHPDVRSAVEGVCPVCRMTLVPIPDPQIGEYRLDVALLPRPAGQGAAGLRLRIGYPDTLPASSSPSAGRPATPALLTVHDKRLHVFLVSRNLEYFAHVHPDQIADGSFRLAQDLPPGEYMVMADFLPAGGTPQMVQRAVVTPGFTAASVSNPPVPSATAIVDGLRGTCEVGDLIAGRLATITLMLADAKTGAPTTDLEPYLSAPAHALFVSADLTQATHAHPREQDAFGPSLSFEFLPALPGLYKMWVQVQRHGRVSALPFVFVVG